MALALVRRIVHRHQQPLVISVLPGKNQETIPGPIASPSGNAFEQLPVAATHDFVAQHAKQLVVKRDVAGLVRFGVEEHNSEHSKLAGLRGNLAPDFIILNEGETPQLGTSVGLLLLGFLIVGGLVFMFKANQEPTTE